MSNLASTLDAVTVFREGALCRRSAKVPASGERQVRLGGLPLSLEAGTLRARVTSGAGRVIDVRPQFDVELAQEVDVPAEQRAWEDAGAKVAQLETQRQRLNTEISELQTLRPAFLEQKRGEPPRPAPVEAMLALGDFTEAELATRLERRRKLDVELADAKAEVQLRARRMQEASTAKRSERAKLSRVAVVTLGEAPASELVLELEYRVPGARWVPSYALTLERGMAAGTLQMRASIAQNTGEDWSQVSLALSTASAYRRADMPELRALKIGRRQAEPPRSGWREPPPGLEALFESYDSAMTSLIPPPAAVPPQGHATGGRVMRDEPAPMPPPPPPPRPAPAAKPMVEMARRAPAAPGNAPMEVAAASMAMPSAPPPMQAPMRSRGAMPKGGGMLGGLSKKMAKEESFAADEDEAPMMDMLSEGGDGFGVAAPEPEPELTQAGLDASFGDYARLMMGAPEAGSQRGRLTAASEWDFAFIAGISVQVDVVVAMVTKAQRIAGGVQGLQLPALCNPVTSIDSFDYRYDCGARLDVPSTGKWVLVPVMRCAVGLTPEYVCVPSVEPKVYRTLTVSNRSAHALLPGPVDVTAGDEFLMTTSLPPIPPGADKPHRLGLGVEEAIKVARKTQYKETTGGFLGGSTVLPHELEIELNNRLAAPALIEVRERVPVVDPSEKDLKVEDGEANPPWEKIEGLLDGDVVQGARRWRVTVPPGGTQKLTAQFAIRMPADRMLVGGNRRN